MATGIILSIIVIIFIFSVKSYATKISCGCCGGGGGAKKIKPSDKDTSNYNFVYKINIEGMTCNHCKRAVENSFNERNGVYAAVNLKQNEAIVRTKNKISKEEIQGVVLKCGYKVVSVTSI